MQLEKQREEKVEFQKPALSWCQRLPLPLEQLFLWESSPTARGQRGVQGTHSPKCFQSPLWAAEYYIFSFIHCLFNQEGGFGHSWGSGFSSLSSCPFC